VEVTAKTPGDQGVDLLVARDAARIAVQAKGYAESVHNDIRSGCH
jgi:HJR/Mrr/RecB family endonuclease